MKELLARIPVAPSYQLDWMRWHEAFAWIRAMQDCQQEPDFHAEGNVWIHTRMVCETLSANAAWHALPEPDRATVFLAALLHDVAKPLCTRLEDGRLTSRGHSKLGAKLARQILWQHGAPFAQREQIVALIAAHQVPFFLLERAEPLPKLIEVSQTARCDFLALVADADARGRTCVDAASQQRIVDNTQLFAQYAEERGCLSVPFAFANDHSRVEFFRKADRDPFYAAYDDTTCEVIVMSGLPGAGKDRWIVRHAPDWPVVSLDDLRRQFKFAPTGNQGVIVARAREQAREHLRRKQSFIWNSTNLSRSMRAHVLSLCADYGARVRIVYVEAPYDLLFAQNQAREHSVPAAVLDKMFDRWEVPDLTEAHAVEYVLM